MPRQISFSGCYSDLKSFITTFVSYFQTKNFKGTFLIYQGAFHQGWNRGRGQLEYPPLETHYLLLQAHLSDSVSNESTLSLDCIKSKYFKFLWQTWDLWVVQNEDKQSKETRASKEHLLPPTHVVGPNPGSPNKTISSAETAPLYA